MAKNEYVIYQCVGKDNNGKKLESIFKLPSFWSYDFIAIALTTLSEDNIVELEVSNDGLTYHIDMYNKISAFGLEFRELDDTDIDVVLFDINGAVTKFKCKKIGTDISNNYITRKTPIVVSCNYHDNPESEMRKYFSLDKERFIVE